MLSICNREPRQSPSITHRARRNCEFCLPPHIEPQTEPCPSKSFVKAQVNPVFGKRSQLKSHASGQLLLSKRLKTTPLKLRQNEKAALNFSSLSPTSSLSLGHHHSLDKENWETFTLTGKRKPTHILQFSAMVIPALHSDGDRHAPIPCKPQKIVQVLRFNSIIPLKWHPAREPTLFRCFNILTAKT